jgi:hypothetical protein
MAQTIAIVAIRLGVAGAPIAADAVGTVRAVTAIVVLHHADTFAISSTDRGHGQRRQHADGRNHKQRSVADRGHRTFFLSAIRGEGVLKGFSFSPAHTRRGIESSLAD